jgi:protein-L-isoaspartate(D-aspartate) O-methyltransferase
MLVGAHKFLSSPHSAGARDLPCSLQTVTSNPVIFNSETDHFVRERREMVESQLRARGLNDERVLDAMDHVPRHEFIAESYSRRAYEDGPLPIGADQTISQPYIVGLALQSLCLQPTDKVLEIGTGSGYQTALLAMLTRHVYSIERREDLARGASDTLAKLGYANLTVLVADGGAGWPEQQPFDAIVVAAAAPRIPAPLFDQLREGGRMVVPVGSARAQELQLVRKDSGLAVGTALGGCSFVPLIGIEGQFPG